MILSKINLFSGYLRNLSRLNLFALLLFLYNDLFNENSYQKKTVIW
ncbi:hypothetical protein yfred0001_35440 [Yersinia frederiksenii ATCC 33641]|nr:hypothetical protein yfred0001_35440 [Yersinia frederiksenii ATCC 33641]